MDVFPQYFEVSRRLLIVGQQTAGWDTCWDQRATGAVTRLMKCYRDFHLAEAYLPTPFWGAAWQLFRRLNPAGPNYGFLWTNLIKVDQDRRRPDRRIRELVATGFRVLAEEVNITKPDVIVFLTGPNYDYSIRLAFPGVAFHPVNDLPERLLAKLDKPADCRHAYRIYHPTGIMRMRGDRQDYYRRILEAIGTGAG